MNLIADSLSTIIEGCGLIYLVKEEQISGRRKILFVVLHMVIFQILTHLIYLDRIGLKLLIGAAIIIFMGKYLLRLTLMKSFFYMGTGYLILLFEELCINQIAVIFHVELGEGYTAPTISIIVGKIVYISLIVYVQKIIEEISRNQLNVKSLLSFFLSNIGYSVVGICIFMNINVFQDTVYRNVFTGCSIMMLFSLIVNILFTERYLAMEQKEKDQMMAIYELELNAKYYEDKLKEEERVKKIYHDLKNHLLLLEGTEKPAINSAESIDRLRKDISKYEDYFKTGNRYLDIILRDKHTKAEQSGIYFEDDIDFQRGGFVEAVDISTIFGNLLDNAIEACELIDENGKRFIQVTAKQKNSLLVISVKNSISDIPVDKDRKNKKIISGYGLLNVENAVHKYEGEISAVKEEGVFNVNIVLPIRKV